MLFDVSGVLADEERARGFGPFGGGTVGIGFVRYLASVPWLGFGAGVRGTFGNSTKGDESYFLNPIFTFATVAAFLPLGPRDSGFELAVDAGFTNILARDDRPGTAGQRLTRHEFGIGPGAGARLGYRLAIPPLSTAVKASIGHSRNWAGVDVNDQPSKTWAMGITSVLVGFEW